MRKHRFRCEGQTISDRMPMTISATVDARFALIQVRAVPRAANQLRQADQVSAAHRQIAVSAAATAPDRAVQVAAAVRSRHRAMTVIAMDADIAACMLI